jgi:integrase
MRRTLTDRGVAALKPRAERYAFPDPELTGHYVRVQPSGARAFVAVARTPAGRQVWKVIGACDVLKIADAREQAREVIKRVRVGLPAIETKPDSVAAVIDNWIKRYAEPNGLRTLREIKRLIKAHILPAWRDREFVSIRRSDITALMDKVEDKHGARSADYCLMILSTIANWHATRNDGYTSPIIRGMRRQSIKERARKRILNDDELRTTWLAAETCGAFGAIVQIALLTAQRRTKIQHMKWADVSIAGEWTIPQESSREKDTAGSIQLPEMALAIIRAQPRVDKNPYVFAGRGHLGPFKGLGEGKVNLDAKLPADMPNWVLHDLRRTARSLMSRAGVPAAIAEKVLGHSVSGVHGTYDRFAYLDEKADALARLAALIDGIVHPRASNIVPMTKQPRRQRQ